ncbi:GNAT family N-acetyltransferase [Streptomyces sp. NBC_01210]|uniref:GNAT family N-acetyltransferase n=1 Tax=Streptomyces sp. NBC_01210 TaxID=2903774 RepID=UPI003FA3DAF9
MHAWPEREREFLLCRQFDARERDWLQRYPPGRLEIIEVEVDGAPAGRIRLSRGRPWTRSRRVVDLAVAREYRRRGVATEALTRCPPRWRRAGPLPAPVVRVVPRTKGGRFGHGRSQWCPLVSRFTGCPQVHRPYCPSWSSA